MNDATLLILESAEHWLDNYDLVIRGETPKITSSHCPLCTVYLAEFGCSSCPIKLKTGMNSCEGTPWSNVAKSQFLIGSDNLISAVAEEYTFLVELAIEHNKANP